MKWRGKAARRRGGGFPPAPAAVPGAGYEYEWGHTKAAIGIGIGWPDAGRPARTPVRAAGAGGAGAGTGGGLVVPSSVGWSVGGFKALGGFLGAGCGPMVRRWLAACPVGG